MISYKEAFFRGFFTFTSKTDWLAMALFLFGALINVYAKQFYQAGFCALMVVVQFWLIYESTKRKHSRRVK